MIATASESLRALASRRVQKATVDAAGRLVLELFGGEARDKRWLVVEGGVAVVATERPAGGGEDPPALQGLVRKELVPSLLGSVEERAPGLLALALERPAGPPRLLLVEADADDPRALLCADTAEGLRILCTLGGASRPRDGRDLRRGRLYEAPKAAPRRLATAGPAAGAARSDDPAERRALEGALRAEAKRLQRLEKALAGDLARHGDAARWQADGELLKGALGRAPRGTHSLELLDFEGHARTLSLDPALDAAANLARFFRRARKSKEAALRVAPRLAAVRERLAAVRAAGASLDADPRDAPSATPSATPSLAPREAVAEAMRLLEEGRAGAAAPSARRRVARSGKRKPWRCFRASGDVVLRVGRGARDNDALVRDARGNDLWLHARDRHGAHVVVPSRGDEVDAELLLDAAHLAAHFSAARGEARVDVQHTRVKHLKKPGPGAPAGLVHVTQESVLHLRVDDERVRRLLAAEVEA